MKAIRPQIVDEYTIQYGEYGWLYSIIENIFERRSLYFTWDDRMPILEELKKQKIITFSRYDADNDNGRPQLHLTIINRDKLKEAADQLVKLSKL
jgi:hypothetical protein